MDKEKEISRRDFLKIGVASFAGLALNRPLKEIDNFFKSSEFESLNKISFRKDRVMEVNGRAVFPLGLYYLPGIESPETWEKMGKSGFNLINQWWVNDETLASAEKNGIYTMAFLQYAFPNIENSGEIDLGRLKKLKESKSFIGIYGADEPLGKSNLYLQSLNKLQKELPDNPISSVFYENSTTLNAGPLDFREYKKSYQGEQTDLICLPDFATADEFAFWFIKKSKTEIVSFDYYNNSNVLGIDSVTEKYIQNLKNGNFGPNAKAVWVTLSAHSETPLTFKEMRFQAIDVIARGATGILWWDWPSGCSSANCPGFPDKGTAYSVHWPDLQNIMRELTDVRDGLIGEEKLLGLSESEKVAFKITKSNTSRHYIITATHSKDQDSKFRENLSTHLTNKYFQVLGEKRIVKTNDKGELFDDYGFMDARIYVEIPKRGPSHAKYKR